MKKLFFITIIFTPLFSFASVRPESLEIMRKVFDDPFHLSIVETRSVPRRYTSEFSLGVTKNIQGMVYSNTPFF